MLTTIQNATENNTADIAEIKMLSTSTEAGVKKVTEQNEANKLSQTPNVASDQHSSPQMFFAYALRRQMRPYRTSNESELPNRKRSESPAAKINRPQPKIGTKSNVSGLTVVSQPERNMKPFFEMALWVSRLNPAVTCEEVVTFITTNTPITDAN